MARDLSTDLALRRTFMAHERTLMAWIRTSTSLISFGFTIYKFFQYLPETGDARSSPEGFGPRGFALSMIGVGLIALAFAIVDYRRTLGILEHEYGQKHASSAGQLAVVIFMMGLFLLILVSLHQ
jgi:putative membrane protein